MPYADAILQAMGLKVDLGVASKSTYSPETAETGSVTIYKFERLAESSKWRLTVATGVRLTGSLTVAMNAEPIISIEGGGTYTTMGEAANFFAADGSIALQKDGATPVVARTTGVEIIADQDPMMCVGMSVTVKGTARAVSAIELALNNTVTALGAVTGAASTIRHVHTRGNQGSRIGGSFTLADYEDAEIDDFINDYEAANEMSASVVFSGGDGRVTLSMPKMQIGLIAGSDTDGLMQFEVPYFLNGDWSDLAADNDFALTFEAAP